MAQRTSTQQKKSSPLLQSVRKNLFDSDQRNQFVGTYRLGIIAFVNDFSFSPVIFTIK